MSIQCCSLNNDTTHFYIIISMNLLKSHLKFSLLPETVSLVALEGNVIRLAMGRFANYLRNIIPHQDVSLTEMVAKAIGELALCEGTYTAG